MRFFVQLFLFALAGSGWFAAQIPPGTAATEALLSPVLLSPQDGADLHTYPRLLEFQWAEVAGATSYAIEIDCLNCCKKGAWCSETQGQGYIVRGLETPGFVFTYWGDQPGRWRAWASRKSGEGAKSEWREFTFANPAGVKTVPPIAPYDKTLPKTDCSWRSAVRPEPGTAPPSLTYAPEPAYSETGNANRINAIVSLEIKVGSEGTVEAVCILSSPRADLAEASVQAVQTWRFAPARRNGMTVPASAHLEIRFRECCDKAVLRYPLSFQTSPANTVSGQAAVLNGGPCASWLSPPPAPGTVLPKAIYAPEPEYTPAARKMKLNGEVALVLKINANGRVEDACVAKSLESGLDQAAVSKLKTWRFEPARKDGVAVPYASYVTVSFRLY